MATIGSLRADLSASSAVVSTESSACGVLMAEGGRRCKLTGHTGFAGAMGRILVDPSVSAGVEKIAVSRPVAAARIEYRAGEGPTEQRFGRAPAALAWVESLLDGGVVHQIATDLREIEDETGEWPTA